MDKVLDRIKSLSRTTKYIFGGAIAVLLIAILLVVVFSGSGDVSISVETSLKEMITTSQLRTAEYTYNSIADITDDDKVKYHVSYKGTVTAGVDFENVVNGVLHAEVSHRFAVLGVNLVRMGVLSR